MKVTAIEVTVHRTKPRKDPLRDALQSLPGTGSVQVVVSTDDGVSGAGDAYFGRIAGGPDALAALIEHELKPGVIGSPTEGGASVLTLVGRTGSLNVGSPSGSCAVQVARI